MGLTAYSESTPLKLSYDVKFVEILVMTGEKTLQYSLHINSPTYACHMTLKSIY